MIIIMLYSTTIKRLKKNVNHFKKIYSKKKKSLVVIKIGENIRAYQDYLSVLIGTRQQFSQGL